MWVAWKGLDKITYTTTNAEWNAIRQMYWLPSAVSLEAERNRPLEKIRKDFTEEVVSTIKVKLWTICQSTQTGRTAWWGWRGRWGVAGWGGFRGGMMLYTKSSSGASSLHFSKFSLHLLLGCSFDSGNSQFDISCIQCKMTLILLG